MKKSYFVIPSIDIFNSESFNKSVRTAYERKSEAIEIAKKLSAQYNIDFFVCVIETKVSTNPVLIDLE